MADEGARQPKDATEHTRAANAAVLDSLPFGDRSDFERARRGRIAPPDTNQVMGRMGFPVWDLDAFAFLEGDAPDTVNPSLWRQAQLNMTAGLFEVADGFYQVRGLDLSNITFIESASGWIVIDPLTSSDTAKAAYDLVSRHLDERPVHTVIYTHSHVDHFAGVRGIVDEADVRSGAVRIIAPEGFLEEAISENVIAGTAMTRRATYMYGALLPKGPRGHVDAGLGKGVPLMGAQGLIAPTELITETGTELDVDGVRIVFQLTPGTEAPAEMNFHFPDRRILCMAENCTANLHNLYTLRGAQIRDALAWSRYIHESIELFEAHTDVCFASHHWPRWGRDDIVDFLTRQRDLYRFIHDQTMRLANHGQTMVEIAEELALPPALGDEFFNRDYYGTLNHNAKAVYQRYLGWFDANPAHLHPHPPVEAARRYVDYMGGADAVLERARGSFADGDYRWVVEVVNHVVFAEPANDEARLLQADALEQLGYQAESGPWRGFYLTGAQELRNGSPAGLPAPALASADVLAAMTVEMLLELMGVRLRGLDAAPHELAFLLTVPDRSETWLLGLGHGAVNHVPAVPDLDADVDATVTLTHAALAALARGTGVLDDLVGDGSVSIDGDAAAFAQFLGYLDTFAFWFPIIEP
jgi:alkyl sulfatase BDS1-like metallo-beta-lactamase superfamily hydrolase